MSTRKSGFDHHAELLRDQERAFHELGPVWGSPRRLFEATLPPGQNTYAAVTALLDHVEQDGEHAQQIRAILVSCQVGTPQSLSVSAVLFGLPQGLLKHVLRVFVWVAGIGGIGPDDFEDGGTRFQRLIDVARSEMEGSRA